MKRYIYILLSIITVVSMVSCNRNEPDMPVFPPVDVVDTTVVIEDTVPPVHEIVNDTVIFNGDTAIFNDTTDTYVICTHRTYSAYDVDDIVINILTTDTINYYHILCSDKEKYDNERDSEINRLNNNTYWVKGNATCRDFVSAERTYVILLQQLDADGNPVGKIYEKVVETIR